MWATAAQLKHKYYLSAKAQDQFETDNVMCIHYSLQTHFATEKSVSNTVSMLGQNIILMLGDGIKCDFISVII